MVGTKLFWYARSFCSELAGKQEHGSVPGPCYSEQPAITGSSISVRLFRLTYGDSVLVAIYISCRNAWKRPLIFPQRANGTTPRFVILCNIFWWWKSSAGQMFSPAVKYSGCTPQERGGMLWRGVRTVEFPNYFKYLWSLSNSSKTTCWYINCSHKIILLACSCKMGIDIWLLARSTAQHSESSDSKKRRRSSR